MSEPPPYPGPPEGQPPAPAGEPYSPQEGSAYPPQTAPGGYAPPPGGYAPPPPGGYAPPPGGYAPPPGGYAPPPGGYAPAPPQGYPEKSGMPPGPGEYPVQTQPQGPAYPPGQGPPQMQYAAGTQTVVVTQPTMVVQTGGFGEVPVTMSCPHCHAQVSTGVHYETGTLTWLICGSICLAGCVLGGVTWLGCCFIPFCIDACKDVLHTCPNCKQLLGRKNRM